MCMCGSRDLHKFLFAFMKKLNLIHGSCLHAFQEHVACIRQEMRTYLWFVSVGRTCCKREYTDVDLCKLRSLNMDLIYIGQDRE
jgi:hypothetical protein